MAPGTTKTHRSLPVLMDLEDEGMAALGRPCPLCGTAMTHRHCKYVCPRHGVVYDCSDTFY